MADEPEDLSLSEAAAELADLPPLDEPDMGYTQEDGDAPEGEEPEAQDDESGEPAKPAIDAPASLNADEKAKFAQLPPEAQRMLADVETRRARQVTEATTNAANAQREAKATAARDVTAAKQTFAQQLHTFAAAYAPQQPNPANYGDMQQYARDHAKWQYASTQHQQLMQQVQAIGMEAKGDADRQQAEMGQQEAQKLRQALPDWFDADKGPKLKDDLTAVGSELGYTPELMAQANAGDLLALNKALGWKLKAAKYDAAMGRQMQGVRAAKTATPGVSQPQGAGKRQAAKDASARLAKSGSLDDAAAAIAAQLR